MFIHLIEYKWNFYCNKCYLSRNFIKKKLIIIFPVMIIKYTNRNNIHFSHKKNVSAKSISFISHDNPYSQIRLYAVNSPTQ